VIIFNAVKWLQLVAKGLPAAVMWLLVVASDGQVVKIIIIVIMYNLFIKQNKQNKQNKSLKTKHQ